MTLLRAAFRGSVENTNTPLTDTNLMNWLRGPRSDAGVSVTEERVLGLPTYYRALTLTAGALGSMPVKVYRDGTREQVARRTVLDKPNPRQTSKEWRITTFLHFIAWGNAYSRKVRGGMDEVRELWPLHPANVRVEAVAPTTENPAGKVFLVRNPLAGTEERLTPFEVLHLPYMSMDGLSGIRPMEVFRQSLGLAIAGDDSAAKLYGNNQMPAGILTVQEQLPDQGAADRIKTRWKQALGGIDKTGEIAVLDNGATFTAVSIPPKDAQLLESRQWSVDEIGRMIGTPPHLVGNVSNSTSWGSGIEQQVLGWLKFTLQTPVSVSEDRWTDELLPPGEFAEHSVEGLLRGDSAARAAFHHASIVDGWGSRAEAREYENRPPAPDDARLDDFIAPSNMTLISVDGSIVPLSSAGADAADATSA